MGTAVGTSDCDPAFNCDGEEELGCGTDCSDEVSATCAVTWAGMRSSETSFCFTMMSWLRFLDPTLLVETVEYIRSEVVATCAM